MNKKMAISFIDTLLEGCYDKPITYYNKNRTVFKEQSYSYSAILEVRKYIADNCKGDAIDCVEKFRKMVDNYACHAQNEEMKFMFSVYYDTVTDLLDRFLEIRDKNYTYLTVRCK